MITRRALIADAGFMALIGTHAISAEIDLDRPLNRIAFGSCAKQWEPQPIWDVIAATEPDLFLFLGDTIYGDWHGKDVFEPTVASLQQDWDQLAQIPEFAAFRKNFRIMATWDNHDYGKHDGGAEFGLKSESKSLFLDFFAEPAASHRRNRAGIYDGKVFGPIGKRVQIILLDTRSFKSLYVSDDRPKEEKAVLNIRGQYLPNQDRMATLLGEDQWNWLEDQLLQPANLRIIASSTQVVSDEKAMEEWGNFPHERQRLFDLIERTGANGVIILSGNVHYSELSVSDEGPYSIYDFTSSGLTHVTPDYATLSHSKRIAGPLIDLNFGLIDFEWNSTDPEITFSAIGADGMVAFSKQIQACELKAQK